MLCICLGWCSVTSALLYTVQSTRDLRELSVEIHFEDDEPFTALATPPSLAKRLIGMHVVLQSGEKRLLEASGNTLSLPDEPIQKIRYRLTSAGANRLAHSNSSTVRSFAIRLELEELLLRPHGLARWQNTRVRYELPDAISVASPGVRSETRGQLIYELLDRPVDWNAYVVLGRIRSHELHAGDARQRLSIVGTTDRSAKKLERWVAAGLDAVNELYGHFPVNDVQILVFAQGPSSDPVPWGEVMRGGGDAVHLYVDATASLATLNSNWVLVHELSHLLHPYVAQGASWLPEGIASYYQNVLRANAESISAKLAWQKLHAGFNRGMRQTDGVHTLARDTRALMRGAKYMRVYWSGAAIALIGDVELRRRSNGNMSLAQVLDKLADCCLPSSRRWPARELTEKLDEIAGIDVFVPLYEAYVMTAEFPDLAATYEALGLSANGKRLDFSNQASAEELRRSIMGSD